VFAPGRSGVCNKVGFCNSESELSTSKAANISSFGVFKSKFIEVIHVINSDWPADVTTGVDIVMDEICDPITV